MSGNDGTTCQENVGFEAIYNLRYEEGSRISTAGCRMRKTDQDISNYSVLMSITNLDPWLFIIENN